MSDKNKSTKAKPRGVCLIGCGNIGFQYDNGRGDPPRSHFSTFRSSPHFFIQAVVEPRLKIGNMIKRKFSVRAYTDLDDFLRKETLDIVVIASPDNSHERILRKLIDRKPALVVCEKPLSLNLKSIPDIVALYQKNHIPLVINYSRRFIKEYAEIKKMMDRKVFGKLQFATIYYSRGLIHNGSHYADLIHWFFGKPKKIIRESSRPGIHAEDPSYACTLLFPGGFEVRLIPIDTSNLIINEIDIVGYKGRVKIDTEGKMTIYQIEKREKFKGFRFYNPYQTKIIKLDRALQRLRENILDFLAGKASLLSPGYNDIQNIQLLQNIIT